MPTCLDTHFAATPTSFTLPTGYSSFYGSSTPQAYCDASKKNVPEHVLMEMDGDRKPDLLVTDKCNDTAVDTDHWLLYKGACNE